MAEPSRYRDFTITLGLQRNHLHLGGAVPKLELRAYSNEGYEEITEVVLTPKEHKLIIESIDSRLGLGNVLVTAGALQRGQLKQELKQAIEAEEKRAHRLAEYRERLGEYSE